MRTSSGNRQSCLKAKVKFLTASSISVKLQTSCLAAQVENSGLRCLRMETRR